MNGLILLLFVFGIDACTYRTEPEYQLICNPNTDEDCNFRLTGWSEKTFPIAIGCPNNCQITFTAKEQLKTYLNRNPTNSYGPLTASVTNPGQRSSELVTAAVVLGLNIKADRANAEWSTCSRYLETLNLCDVFGNGVDTCAPYYGSTILDVYNSVARAAGGCETVSDAEAQQLISCVNFITNTLSGGQILSQIEGISATPCEAAQFGFVSPASAKANTNDTFASCFTNSVTIGDGSSKCGFPKTEFQSLPQVNNYLREQLADPRFRLSQQVLALKVTLGLDSCTSQQYHLSDLHFCEKNPSCKQFYDQPLWAILYSAEHPLSCDQVVDLSQCLSKINNALSMTNSPPNILAKKVCPLPTV